MTGDSPTGHGDMRPRSARLVYVSPASYGREAGRPAPRHFRTRREAGTHEVVFEASGLPSGTYLVRLVTPAGSFVQTMQLMK